MANEQNNPNQGASALAELRARMSSVPKPKKNIVRYNYSEQEKAILAKRGVGVTHNDLMTLAQSADSKARCAALSNPGFKKGDLTKRLEICTELKQVPEVQTILCNPSLKRSALMTWAGENHDPKFVAEVLTAEVNASLSARLNSGK